MLLTALSLQVNGTHSPMIPTTIIRHPKERLAKCTLEPLRDHIGLTFRKASRGFIFNATGYTLLTLDAPVLETGDAVRPLLLLDATWRLLPQLERCLTGEPVRRTLPRGIQTAYPRVSKIDEMPNPFGGLASVEALFVAQAILGRPEPTLLAHYRWKDTFLAHLVSTEGIDCPGISGADSEC